MDLGIFVHLSPQGIVVFYVLLVAYSPYYKVVHPDRSRTHYKGVLILLIVLVQLYFQLLGCQWQALSLLSCSNQLFQRLQCSAVQLGHIQALYSGFRSRKQQLHLSCFNFCATSLHIGSDGMVFSDTLYFLPIHSEYSNHDIICEIHCHYSTIHCELSTH